MRTLGLTAAFLMGVLGLASAARADEPRKLFFEGDIVRHAVEDQAGPFCVLNNQFRRKEGVAWRIRVLEPSGAAADNKVLKSLVVRLGNGLELPAHYGPHSKPPTDYFWSLHWIIPDDFPTGSLGYKVIATMMDGSTVTWEPFKREPTQLTIIAGDPVMKAK